MGVRSWVADRDFLRTPLQLTLTTVLQIGKLAATSTPDSLLLGLIGLVSLFVRICRDRRTTHFL